MLKKQKINKKTIWLVIKLFLALVILSVLFYSVNAVAPDIPTLVSPANASTNLPLSVVLQANVTDGDGGTLDVYFYQYISPNHQTDDTEDIYNFTYHINQSRFWEIDHNETDCVDENWSTYGDGIDDVSMANLLDNEVLYLYEYFNIPTNVSSANITSKINFTGGYYCYVTDWFGSCDNYQYNFTGNITEYYNGSVWKDIPMNIYGNVSGTNITSTIPLDGLNNNDHLLLIRHEIEYTDEQTYSGTGYGDAPGWYKIAFSRADKYYESKIDWYGDELGLIGEDLSVNVNEIATSSYTTYVGNNTYYWFANVTDGSDITKSYTYYFTTGNKPVITDYNFNDSTPEYLESVYIYANVTDYDSDTIQNVTYVLSYPNNSIITYYNISGTEGYKTDLILLNQYGLFSVNITAFANNDSSTIQTLTYDISDGNASSNPSSWILSQESGQQSTESFNITNTGNSWVEYNISIEGTELTNSSMFILTYPSQFNVSNSGSEIFNVNLTSISENVTNTTTYYGNITITETIVGDILRIPITLSISTSGVGVVDLVDYPSNYKSITITQNEQEQWDLNINNTGNRTLTNCNVSISGTASSFTILQNYLSFTIPIGTVHTTTVKQTPTSTGTYQGIIQVTCTATAEGGLNTETLTEDISVISSGDGGTGGGGGGGGSDSQERCNIKLPDKIIISRRNPVQPLNIKNLNEFSYDPITKVSKSVLEPDGSGMIKIKGEIGAIQSEETGQLSVIIRDDSIFDTLNETHYAIIEVSSSRCLPEYVEVEITNKDILSDFSRFFTDFSYFTSTMKDFFTKKLSILGLDIPLYLISLLIAVSIIIINTIIFRGKRESGTKIITFSLLFITITEVLLFWLIF